jgi:iron complex transport system ATP-binding protein
MTGNDALSLEAITVVLGGRTVLSNVSISFAPHQVTAVLGPNGAGKSTLLTCLGGLMSPTAGDVLLSGRSLKTIPDRERARRIGILPQAPEVAWPVDVETLVGLGRIPYGGALGGGLGSEDRAIIARVLEQTSTAAFAQRIATTLSGGERSRVLMARALAGQPEWLLADEPLTGLDPGHQFDACDLLRAIADEGRGVVVTLHDLSLAARLADRVVVLAEGRVVADGPPREALTEALLTDVYGVDARVEDGADGLSVTLLGRSSRLGKSAGLGKSSGLGRPSARSGELD